MDNKTKRIRRVAFRRIDQLARLANPTWAERIEELELRRLVHLQDLATAHPTAVAGIQACIANIDAARAAQ